MTEIEKIADACLPDNPLMPWREQIRANIVRAMQEQAAAMLLLVNAAIRERDEARAQLRRIRKGYLNIIEFRRLAFHDRYGALTREEIEAVIAEIDATLGLTSGPREAR